MLVITSTPCNGFTVGALVIELGAKDDRTGKSDVLRTWNPEPGVPVEMS